VAIISVLFSFIGKKIGTILQAIFGWSVTALFGRLPKKKQLAVTVALILSIAWPVFVIGSFFPAVAGWVLAILPLEKWVGPTVLRVVWIALAVISAPIVGMLVHWAAPAKKTTLPKAALNGYPLALGFFIAFITTAITVPIVKVVSILRGWAESHVYMQPRAGRYDSVLHELAEACVRAGLEPRIDAPPRRMTIATDVLKTLAKGAVSPIVAEHVKVVYAKGLEMYLYPSDLLIRGEDDVVARVRAMLTRTDVDRDAYLVGTEAGQTIQDELGRLLDVAHEHEEAHYSLGEMATRRLVEIWREANEAKLPFDEWVMIESIARRVERRLVVKHGGAPPMPLDSEEDALVQRETKEERIETVMNKQLRPQELEASSTADLVREALDEAKELVRLEVQIAKNEVKTEIDDAKKAAIGFGIALAMAVLFLSTLAIALVLALGGTVLAAIGVSSVFLVGGGIAAYLGYAKIPKSPLGQTRRRVESDVQQLKEHIA
jgi:hypothetical protein